MDNPVGLLKGRGALPGARPRLRSVAVLTSVLACTACAQTRSVEPVAMSQQGDQNLTCVQLNQQIYTNQVAAVNFANQAAKVEGNNTAFQVGTIFTLWAAMGINLSKEDQIKMRSLQDRNQYLLYLKEEKKC
jgi:hypothetical protein